MAKTTYKNYPNPIIEKSPPRSLTLASATYTLPVQNNIQRGTLMLLTSGSETIYKSGKVYEAVTAGTTIKMYKNHSFGVGDDLYDGATGVSITAIDTTNDAYDSLTVDSAVTLTLNEVVYSTNAGAVGSADLAVVAETVVWETGDTPDVAISDKAVLELTKMPCFWAASVEASNIKTV